MDAAVRSVSENESASTADEVYRKLEFGVMRQPLNSELLRLIMECCYEPKTVEEVEDYLSVYSAETSRAIIDVPRALKQLTALGGVADLSLDVEQGSDDEEAESSDGSEASASDDGVASPGALDADRGTENSSEEEADGEPESAAVEPACYLTTDAGVLFCERHDPALRLKNLMSSDPAKQPVYQELLQWCSDEPKSLAYLDRKCRESDAYRTMLENHPGGLHPSTLISDLEKAGACIWEDGWTLSDSGRDYLSLC